MKNSFVCFILLLSFCCSSIYGAIERRAAIDIGSGGTKVAIADVETDNNSIVALLFDSSYQVPYQASLDKSNDGTFDEETRALGVKVFKEIKQIAKEYQVEKISAIATSAFRKANNSKAFVQEVKRAADIEIKIIPQREEGEIAFYSVLAAGAGQFEEKEVVVWDIGTGSLQMTTMNQEQGLTVYMGEQMGSVAFKSYIMDTIQEKESLSTPNPISDNDLKLADSYARAFGRKAYPLIKEKIKSQKGRVAGIGRLFYNSIRPLAAEGEVITRDGLRSFIRNSLNKNDEELNNPFAHVDVSNCILTLAIMKALHIQEIYPVETTTTRGLLISSAYWS